MFSRSLSGVFLYLRKFSRTRSKTTTVSFSEYPTIVNRAAIIAKSNLICKRLKMPIVITMSCTSAAIAPTENCHSNLNQI